MAGEQGRKGRRSNGSGQTKGARATGKGRRRSGYHHGNLREALIEAASEILEQDGIAALSLRRAARRAGVSQTAPYRHFADKTALLAALAVEGFRGLTAHMEAAAEGIADPVPRMRALGRGYVRFALAHTARIRLMFGPEIPDKEAYPDLFEAAREAYGVLSGATNARAGGPDTEGGADVAIAAWAIVHGLAMLLVDGQIKAEMRDGGDCSADDLTDRVTRFLNFPPGTEGDTR